jgi:hypothetical protein
MATVNFLTETSKKHLFNLQGLLGEKTIEKTIERIYNDYIIMMPEKGRFDVENKITVGDFFKKFVRGESSHEDEIIIINLTKNVPYGSNSLFEKLKNGVPGWDLSRLLRERYSDSIISQIINGINEKGGTGAKYRVIIPRDTTKKVSIYPLTSIMQSFREYVN